MSKRVLILGIDGYIGYPLALHLLDKDYEVCGLDNYSRRSRVKMVGSDSLTPIPSTTQRDQYLRSHNNFHDAVSCINLESYNQLNNMMNFIKPDVIVHLAEQPSAPWSMMNTRACIDTQVENIAGTLSLLWAMRKHCPNAHLVKLGTMGEYGTPPLDIPEGEIPRKCIGNYSGVSGSIVMGHVDCPMSGLMFPRQPPSFYHASKVHDTINIKFACDTWGLRSTDIMQGVVYGQWLYDTHELNLTRLDYDQYFGTCINRFCVQAFTDIPLTIYGKGNQRRGFLPLIDSINCIKLLIDNPPNLGEYRVVNQFEQHYSIVELAKVVQIQAAQLNLDVDIKNLTNPRIELDKHYYNPSTKTLRDLGYNPSTTLEDEVYRLLIFIDQFKHRINLEVIKPTTTWR